MPGYGTSRRRSTRLDGQVFEERSARLLESYGLRVVARQYRCKVGEIDLVATDDHRLLFVEVRARQSRHFGGAAASVNRAKQGRLARCAAFFLSQNPQWRHLPCRFDVITWEPLCPRGEPTARLAQSEAGAAFDTPRQTPHGASSSDGMQARWFQGAFLL